MARYPALPTPERPRGTTEEKVDKMYTYLWLTIERLNTIIDNLNKEASANVDRTNRQ